MTQLSTVQPAEEYGRAARAWEAFCNRHGKAATLDGANLGGEPLAVTLLMLLSEPVDNVDVFTGDLIADAIGGVRRFVKHLDGDASEGGAARASLHGFEIEGLARRLDALLMLREYERAYRKLGKPVEGGAA